MQKQEKYNSTFATNLRDLIAQRGTTITAISKALGISRQAVSQYTDGTGQPNVDKLAMIADYFGVSTDYLVGLSEIPTRNETIRGIHEKTGLSEDAVSSLMTDQYVEDHKTANFVSFLIASEGFERLVGEITKLSLFHNTTIDATLGVGGDLYNVDFEAAFKLIVTDMFWEIARGYNNPFKLPEIHHPITT